MKQTFTLSLIISALILAFSANGQSYTNWFTGNTEDVQVQPQFGICLMGGAGESDEAMKWFLERANGGDVLVLRTSGSDGYNDYLYSELGVTVNSVETIRFDAAAAATDPYVLDKLSKAEAIWLAGGDQAVYESFWKNTAVEDAINNLLNVVGGPVGGISAGMAIMGQSYFPASNGTITQEAALANPFAPQMQFGYDDFVDAPFLNGVITETHLNDPDRIRYGRITAFMARLGFDHDVRPLGIGSNEFCAVAIDENGIGRAFGEFPEFDDDYIYFLQANCVEPSGPEIMEAATPLTWLRNEEAVKVYKVPATLDGENFFDLNDWNSGSGGTWQNWYVDSGMLTMENAEGAPACFLSVRGSNKLSGVSLYPNPTEGMLNLKTNEASWTYSVYDVSGRILMQQIVNRNETNLDVSGLSSGIYKIVISSNGAYFSASFVRI